MKTRAVLFLVGLVAVAVGIGWAAHPGMGLALGGLMMAVDASRTDKKERVG